MKCLLKLCITLLCHSLLGFATEAQQPTYINHFCDNSTRNSTYEFSLKQLLSSLRSNTTLNDNRFTNGFYNATAGGGGVGSATVYGLFLCRGDVSPSTCQDCVSFATTDVTNTGRCPVQKAAIVWYDQCMLRYSNISFFSIMDTQPAACACHGYNVTQQESFNKILGSTMNNVATKAARSQRKFATGKANFTVFQTLYSLMQCRQDISSIDCERCLTNATAELTTCCGGRSAASMLHPSCNIQYAFYPFYNEISIAAPAPPPAQTLSPPPPALVSTHKGEAVSIKCWAS